MTICEFCYNNEPEDESDYCEECLLELKEL